MCILKKHTDQNIKSVKIKYITCLWYGMNMITTQCFFVIVSFNKWETVMFLAMNMVNSICQGEWLWHCWTGFCSTYWKRLIESHITLFVLLYWASHRFLRLLFFSELLQIMIGFRLRHLCAGIISLVSM